MLKHIYHSLLFQQNTVFLINNPVNFVWIHLFFR